MKKLFVLLLVLLMGLTFSAFTYESDDDDEDPVFSIDELYDYQKEYKSEEIDVCAGNSSKTYMDYRSTTARDSRQFWFIRDELTVDKETGFLYDEDGFIGVALGSFYGEIGDRFYFTLDSGVVLPLVKCEEKADWDTDYSNCYHLADRSVIEFVIDKNYAMAYFGRLSNDYILNGNFNNYHLFKGNIVKVERVLDEKNENYVTFEKNDPVIFDNYDIFNYGSGY